MIIMTVINVTNARQKLFQLISDVNDYSEPVTITNSKGKNAVLISEDDWKSIEETLYLNSITNMAESIIEGGKEPLSGCTQYSEDEEW
jgi:prevent-host-death family protein